MNVWGNNRNARSRPNQQLASLIWFCFFFCVFHRFNFNIDISRSIKCVRRDAHCTHGLCKRKETNALHCIDCYLQNSNFFSSIDNHLSSINDSYLFIYLFICARTILYIPCCRPSWIKEGRMWLSLLNECDRHQ